GALQSTSSAASAVPHATLSPPPSSDVPQTIASPGAAAPQTTLAQSARPHSALQTMLVPLDASITPPAPHATSVRHAAAVSASPPTTRLPQMTRPLHGVGSACGADGSSVPPAASDCASSTAPRALRKPAPAVSPS